MQKMNCDASQTKKQLNNGSVSTQWFLYETRVYCARINNFTVLSQFHALDHTIIDLDTQKRSENHFLAIRLHFYTNGMAK